MKILLNLIFFLTLSNLVPAQSNLLNGDWQYFDKKENYHELTVTNKFIYVYDDSLPPYKLNIKDYNDKFLKLSDDSWKFISKTDSIFLVTNSAKDSLLLFQLNHSKISNTVKSFYDWYKDPHRNGNGVRIFMEDAESRKQNLISKIKNGL